MVEDVRANLEKSNTTVEHAQQMCKTIDIHEPCCVRKGPIISTSQATENQNISNLAYPMPGEPNNQTFGSNVGDAKGGSLLASLSLTHFGSKMSKNILDSSQNNGYTA